MEVLSEAAMTARMDFMRPLHPKPEEPESLWCIPFDYGSATKGTRISVSKAKEIAAELRALVAEAEKRELRRALDRERDSAAEAHKQASAAREEAFNAQAEIAALKAKLRRRGKRGGGR